jgi:hypothetical protein
VERHDSSTDEVGRYFLSGEGLRDVPAQAHRHADPDGTSTSVRQLEYRGHDVRIETTYRITIDGQPLLGHVEVLPNGAVHYHPFPQYAPSSAVEVVKAAIDTFWDKPPVPDELEEGHEPPPHGAHQDQDSQP